VLCCAVLCCAALRCAERGVGGQVEALVDRADADGNGSVDFTEFRQLFAADARARAQRDQAPPALPPY
jgi:hypothetical protein